MQNISEPSLFGQKNSNRDYSNPKSWGKNLFNSSFPASLVAYMSSKGIEPVYIKTDKKGEVIRSYISGELLFGLHPLSDELRYEFESSFLPYENFFIGKKWSERTDLVLINRSNSKPIRGLEVKLTALPDSKTKDKPEDQRSCELVFRSSTICYIACSICSVYNTDRKRHKLLEILSKVPNIENWKEEKSVLPLYPAIRDAILMVMQDMCKSQTPLVLQSVWKTDPQINSLTDDCLDVFVWSNTALIKVLMQSSPTKRKTKSAEPIYSVSRVNRSVIWLYRMVFDYAIHKEFNYGLISKELAYSAQTDKAFSIAGTSTYKFLHCDELTHPRIHKNEIKNIILGGGQAFLKPERR